MDENVSRGKHSIDTVENLLYKLIYSLLISHIFIKDSVLVMITVSYYYHYLCLKSHGYCYSLCYCWSLGKVDRTSTPLTLFPFPFSLPWSWRPHPSMCFSWMPWPVLPCSILNSTYPFPPRPSLALSHPAPTPDRYSVLSRINLKNSLCFFPRGMWHSKRVEVQMPISTTGIYASNTYFSLIFVTLILVPLPDVNPDFLFSFILWIFV